MNEDSKDQSLPQLCHIAFADGEIKAFGAPSPDHPETDFSAWRMRLEISQEGRKVVVTNNAFTLEFMRQAEQFDPGLMAGGQSRGWTDCHFTAGVDVGGILFGCVSADGHLLLAMNDAHGNRRVAYLSPDCFAPDFFRRALGAHPLTAFGVPSPYPDGRLYSVDVRAAMERFCDLFHWDRLGRDPTETYGTPVEFTGHVALFLQAVLFDNLRMGGAMRRHLHEIAEAVRRSS